MNRNVESHFSQVPSVDIQRSIFDRSCSHKTSFNVGDLIPLYIDEVLPGDSAKVISSKVLRLQTLLTPIFDNLYMDTYWFFVPSRIVWEHWPEFCGENTKSAWAPDTEYTIPKIKSPDGGFALGTIADFFGLPVLKEFKSGVHLPSALPFRAYAKICDEFFRDENLSDPLNIPVGDANQDGSNGSDYISDVVNGGRPFKVAKYHDYFTSCLPNPQKGRPPSVKIGSDFVGGFFPVISRPEKVDFNLYPDSLSLSNAITFYRGTAITGLTSGTPVNYDKSNFEDNVFNANLSGSLNEDYYSVGDQQVPVNSDGSPINSPVISGVDGAPALPANLWANVPSQELSGSPIDINELRLAFAAQRFLERNARGGTRYVELLKSHFGVTSPDARLQRPEYLGGNRIRLNVSAVSNTAQSENDFLGDLGAQSVTADIHFDVRKSFSEHGYLMCVGCARYDHTYSQGMERFWFREKLTDFYFPVFANIGEQPVYTDEIFYQNSDDVFGYQEAWADYRYKPNRVSSEMRPGVPNTLAFWHLADEYDTAPTLSDGWIREEPAIVDRVLAVGSQNANQIFGDFYFKVTMTRPMPMYSVPGLIDHN